MKFWKLVSRLINFSGEFRTQFSWGSKVFVNFRQWEGLKGQKKKTVILINFGPNLGARGCSGRPVADESSEPSSLPRGLKFFRVQKNPKNLSRPSAGSLGRSGTRNYYSATSLGRSAAAIPENWEGNNLIITRRWAVRPCRVGPGAAFEKSGAFSFDRSLSKIFGL